MKIYAFGAEDAPVILLLPDTYCRWRSNFGHVIPLLADDCRVRCVSYDGFDETERTGFPTMPEETEKIESYIREHCGGHIRTVFARPGMVHLYSPEVQARSVALGLTTEAKIKRNQRRFKLCCIPGYIAYVLVCVCAVNGARGFLAGLWQLLLILSVMNLADRLGIDGWWVGHTKAWIIPGTEDLRPRITAADKRKKWMAGTVDMAVIAAVLAGIMVLLVR